MAFLEQFSADERDLLVSLPYRAGLWISHADGKGGTEADAAEHRALEATISSRTRGLSHSAFAHEAIAELWARKNQWQDWGADLSTVPVQCAEAARLINAKLPRRDLDGYRATVMRIATAVAKAYREGGRLPATKQFKLVFGRIGAFFRNEPYDPLAILNISPAEEKALDALGRYLSTGADVAVDDTGIPDQTH